MNTVLELEHLTYTYSPGTPFEHTALDDVSLSIEQGEFLGIIGHTGSGKSTLIQQLNGLLRPTSGRVLLHGRDIWAEKQKLREVRFEVGLVFQYPEYQLFEETVEKDIAFGPTNMGLSAAEIRERVRQAISLVGLPEEILKKNPFDLSGGQKRRVAIAGVIAMRPSVLILDEPTAGLDPRGRELILQQIRTYHNETGSTVLLVSHSMEDIARYASRALVLNHARVFAYGTVDEIFHRGEELEAIGLSVPQVTRVIYALRKKGYDLPENIYTVEGAAKALLPLLRGRDSQC